VSRTEIEKASETDGYPYEHSSEERRGLVTYIPGLKKTESPKSVALSGESSLLLRKRKFSGLRSRCMTPMEWQL